MNVHIAIYLQLNIQIWNLKQQSRAFVYPHTTSVHCDSVFVYLCTCVLGWYGDGGGGRGLGVLVVTTPTGSLSSCSSSLIGGGGGV